MHKPLIDHIYIFQLHKYTHRLHEENQFFLFINSIKHTTRILINLVTEIQILLTISNHFRTFQSTENQPISWMTYQMWQCLRLVLKETFKWYIPFHKEWWIKLQLLSNTTVVPSGANFIILVMPSPGGNCKKFRKYVV